MTSTLSEEDYSPYLATSRTPLSSLYLHRTANPSKNAVASSGPSSLLSDHTPAQADFAVEGSSLARTANKHRLAIPVPMRAIVAG